MEHRHGKRYGLEHAVRLHARNGVVIPGQLANISLSGGFVATDFPISLLMPVRVHVCAQPEVPGQQLVLDGRIVRRDRYGLGIEWSQWAAEAMRALLSVTVQSLPAEGDEIPQSGIHFDGAARAMTS